MHRSYSLDKELEDTREAESIVLELAAKPLVVRQYASHQSTIEGKRRLGFLLDVSTDLDKMFDNYQEILQRAKEDVLHEIKDKDFEPIYLSRSREALAYCESNSNIWKVNSCLNSDDIRNKYIWKVLLKNNV